MMQVVKTWLAPMELFLMVLDRVQLEQELVRCLRHSLLRRGMSLVQEELLAQEMSLVRQLFVASPQLRLPLFPCRQLRLVSQTVSPDFEILF